MQTTSDEQTCSKTCELGLSGCNWPTGSFCVFPSNEREMDTSSIISISLSRAHWTSCTVLVQVILCVITKPSIKHPVKSHGRSLHQTNFLFGNLHECYSNIKPCRCLKERNANEESIGWCEQQRGSSSQIVTLLWEGMGFPAFLRRESCFSSQSREEKRSSIFPGC